MGFSGEKPGSTLADQPQILLVDDDPLFGKIMTRLAEQGGIKLSYCRSLDELSQKDWEQFGSAIVDYDLDTATGLGLIRQMEAVLGCIPIILISHSREIPVPISSWPTSIKGFMHKELGHFAILEAARAANEVALKQHHRGDSPAWGRQSDQKTG